MLLQSIGDYTGYDQVPLVRDLIVLTNPFRALNLVESTPATPHRKPLSLGTYRRWPLGPAMQPAAYTRPLTAGCLRTATTAPVRAPKAAKPRKEHPTRKPSPRTSA